MGNYAQCWLDEFLLGSTKNNVDFYLISLFRPTDKRIISAAEGQLPKKFEHYREMAEGDITLNVVYYEVEADVARDRLEIMGYTLANSKKAFKAWIEREYEFLSGLRNESHADDTVENDRNIRELEVLSVLDADSWIDRLKTIADPDFKPIYKGVLEYGHDDSILNYVLGREWQAFPGYDRAIPLRLAIEALSPQKLIYDLTDVVWAEYLDEDDDITGYGINASDDNYNGIGKIIVLTEGKSDAWILQASLDVLYPHLRDYFSFLDFEGTSIGGGVGSLANMVKAFAGAGIINNVIALFDNDTAAASACRPLERINLPANIAIRRLPDLDMLRFYPTIGPSGKVDLDVNGIAASIELYLGSDVLVGDDLQPLPVQWTGFDRGMNKYQGEVLEKGLIHERFKQKLKKRSGLNGQEWYGIRAIFKTIFSAFDEKNGIAICQEPQRYYESIVDE